MIELIPAIKELDNMTLKLYICRVFEARLGLSWASAAAGRARSQPVGEVGAGEKGFSRIQYKDGSYEQDYRN